MRRITSIVTSLRPILVGLLIFAATAAQATEIGGRYCGRLFSGTGLVDAVTVLAPGKDGRLEGVYSFRDGDAMTDGTLREQQANGFDRTLIWTDKYGSGRLLITFASDYLSFSGFWGAGDDAPTAPWDGRRCSMDTVEDRGPPTAAAS